MTRDRVREICHGDGTSLAAARAAVWNRTASAPPSPCAGTRLGLPQQPVDGEDGSIEPGQIAKPADPGPGARPAAYR